MARSLVPPLRLSAALTGLILVTLAVAEVMRIMLVGMVPSLAREGSCGVDAACVVDASWPWLALLLLVLAAGALAFVGAWQANPAALHAAAAFSVASWSVFLVATTSRLLFDHGVLGAVARYNGFAHRIVAFGVFLFALAGVLLLAGHAVAGADAND